MRHISLATALALTLVSTPAALAAPVPAQVTTQGEPLGAAHADPSEHGEAHAAGEHHVDYLGDPDGDGTPTWRDPEHNGETNPDYMVLKLIQHGFNLALLLAVIGYLARRPLGDALRNRAANIRKDITTAAKLRDEAEQHHAEVEARLANFEAEVAAMTARTEADAKAEEERLVERARAEADRIREIAERNIRDEVTRARHALRAEAVDLAVQLAERTLRSNVESEDQRRLARQFLDAINSNGVNGHG